MQGMAQASKAETFSFQITMVAEVSALVAWFEQALPGERVAYAEGFVFPRDAEAAKLAGAWQREGFVHLVQARGERGRTIWQAERSSAGAAAPRQKRDFREDLTRTQMRNLMDELRRAADRGQPCPSRSALAVAICGSRKSIAGEMRKGRDRVGYLLRRLADENKITVEAGDATRAPVVTIVAKGRGCGKRTAASASSSAAVGRQESKGNQSCLSK
jgi:hypothetical protein